MTDLTVEMTALVNEFARKILATTPTPKQLREIMDQTMQTVETNAILTLRARE